MKIYDNSNKWSKSFDEGPYRRGSAPSKKYPFRGDPDGLPFNARFFGRVIVTNTHKTYRPRHVCNKAVIDRRFRPRCCQLRSFLKRLKSRPERPLACNWYYCAPFIAKPKDAHALRSVRRDAEQLWLTMTSATKPEVHNVSLRRQSRTEPRP